MESSLILSFLLFSVFSETLTLIKLAEWFLLIFEALFYVFNRELAVIPSTQSLHLFILISTFLGARSE